MDRLGRWALLLGMLLAGCATSQEKPAAPQIQRISAEELERLLPKPDPNLTYDELVRLSREGLAPEAIIEKIRQSNSSYELTPSQALELGKKGVDAKVLDHMHSAREQALRDGFADELNKRDRDHRAQTEALQHELLMTRPSPFCDPFWGPYPPYWRYPYYRR
jgi:hypothetical protein